MILYDVSQAAKELGISPITVRRKVQAKELSHRRIGSLIRFTPEDINAYLEATKVPAKKAIHD
jgi:excisionase family DNA binding protein